MKYAILLTLVLFKIWRDHDWVGNVNSFWLWLVLLKWFVYISQLIFRYLWGYCDFCLETLLQSLSLQKKWKHLRDNFARELKRQKTLPSGSQARKGTYMYFRRLQFLEDSVSSKETISNIENEGEGLCDDVDVTGEHREKGITSTSAKKKMKLNPGDLHIANILERSLLARQIEENDEDKLFCLSLYKEMKKVPEKIRLMTKIELLNVLHRAQTLGTPHPIQPVQYANSHTLPLPHSSGDTGQPRTPSSPSVVHPMTTSPGGAASQVSDTQSDYIDMFDQ
ncbi:uncharacterized protein LOC122261317 [Penaeus japonicus]|uniref:uncharacterized protein LOC122261317 n=1 Tax=Penaeus japonicus TaxID=27405 RepID=UPI001C710A4D|nr:uncharacterized protein LOC122261317 [Penaeus japonicus]